MYYMFGFLFLVFIILLITCSEATILLCYFHLCAEVRVHTAKSTLHIHTCDGMHILENHVSFYFHLFCVYAVSQDYHWQWRSFLTSGFTAVYFLVYAIHYFFSKLQISGLASTILYFGYTMIMALIFFLFTGLYVCRVKVQSLVKLCGQKRSIVRSTAHTDVTFKPAFCWSTLPVHVTNLKMSENPNHTNSC